MDLHFGLGFFGELRTGAECGLRVPLTKRDRTKSTPQVLLFVCFFFIS
jgi:hypothetical protein